jgi:hypothetical protein
MDIAEPMGKSTRGDDVRCLAEYFFSALGLVEFLDVLFDLIGSVDLLDRLQLAGRLSISREQVRESGEFRHRSYTPR